MPSMLLHAKYVTLVPRGDNCAQRWSCHWPTRSRNDRSDRSWIAVRVPLRKNTTSMDHDGRQFYWNATQWKWLKIRSGAAIGRVRFAFSSASRRRRHHVNGTRAYAQRYLWTNGGRRDRDRHARAPLPALTVQRWWQYARRTLPFCTVNFSIPANGAALRCPVRRRLLSRKERERDKRGGGGNENTASTPSDRDWWSTTMRARRVGAKGPLVLLEIFVSKLLLSWYHA
jgi:hypothetical protein